MANLSIFLSLFIFIFSINQTLLFKFNEDSIENYLWPLPNLINKGNSTFQINLGCRFTFYYGTDGADDKDFKNLEKIVKIYKDILIKKSAKLELSYSFNSNDFLLSKDKCDVLVNIKTENLEIKKFSQLYETSDESYNLKFTSKENSLIINLQSNYINGVVRGLETLSQILHYSENAKSYVVYDFPLEIIDEPEFKFRGVMIDSGRHFISVNTIKEIIDGMMYSKLNVLHWHMTEDELFTFPSDMIKDYKYKKYIYSKQDILDLIKYALTRGVTIIPEIDNPSHTKSWKIIDDSILLSIPEYGNLDPSKEETYKIVSSLIYEVISLFNSDYIHLGGDEVLSNLWSTTEINNFMNINNLETLPQLENYYFNRIRKEIPESNSYIYWVSEKSNYIYDVYNENNSVLMYWGFAGNLDGFLKKFKDQTIERNLIICSADILYLDCGSGNKYGDKAWCGNYKTWKTIYNYTIPKKINNFNILGGQTVLFGELADENSIVGKIYPRATSFAEKLWTKHSSDNENLAIKKVFIRLLNQNKRLVERGVKSISFTTQLCEDDPLECINQIN